MTDEDLLQRARGGSRRAFQLLYTRYRDRLFRCAYRLTGSSAVAEDIVHDCFLALLRNPNGLRADRGGLRPYLYGVVRNLSYKSFRIVQRETVDEDLDEKAPDPDILDDLVSRELSQEVQQAVAALPHLQREVIVLFEFEEMSLSEVAAVVGTDVNTVKARLHRARRRLIRGLRESVSPAGEKQS